MLSPVNSSASESASRIHPQRTRTKAPQAALCRLALVLTLSAAWMLVPTTPVTAQDGIRALDSLVTLDGLDTPTDDLIRLATSHADAIYELKKARLSLDTVQQLRPSVNVTNLEVNVASLAVEAAERKVRIIRAITEKRLAAAENKLEILNRLQNVPTEGNQAKINPRAYIRIQDQATIEILKMILNMK